MAVSQEAPPARVSARRQMIDDALLDRVADHAPDVLQAPVAYVLQGGGKRVRPTLLLLVAEAYGAPVERAFPAALAVEVFHNFTLVHDDIMDEAEERRARPTVHERWDVGTAILTGDLLMGLSYELLGEVDGAEADALYQVYHPMVEQLCRGQALDASFEAQNAVSVEAYLDMIDGKTAALLSAAVELGGLVAGAPSPDHSSLRRAGQRLGRAFQIQDDLLDLTAETDDWGKAVGGDLVSGKKTFLTLRALEKAKGAEYDWFARLVTNGGLPASDIPEARDRMDRLGVFEEAESVVARYLTEARDHLAVLPSGPAATALSWLIDEIEDRRH